MPAPRYTGWHHTRYEGDRASCARYLPLARKVLGFVVQEASRQQLQVYSYRQPIQENNVEVGEIVAELHGGQPRVLIRVFGGAAPKPEKFKFAGFVAWPRNDEHEDGFNVEHPQVGFFTRNDDQWTTLYFDQSDPPWAAVASPKGTYELLSNGQPMFPLGLNDAGNIDWIGPEGKLQLSWYGPRGRYHPTFSDTLRKLVFYRGKLFLDLADYAAANGRSDVDAYVLGAAIKDGRLYVLTTSDFGYRDDDAATHKLIRFDLEPGIAADGLQRLAVKQDETESPAAILWTAARDRSMAPYFFNASVTQACRVGYKPGTNNDDENELATLSIDADDNVSLATEAANMVTTITRTEIFPPVVIPGTTYYHYILDEPAFCLLGRDFKGDTPKDIRVEFREYEREDKTAQDGVVKIEWADEVLRLVLHVGDLELMYLDDVSLFWIGNLGTLVKPNELLATFDFHYPLALDARFDAAATVHIVQRFYGDLWNMGDYNEVQADCETRVFFGTSSDSLGPRTIARQTYGSGINFETIIGGDLWGIHGPLSWLNEVVGDITHINTTTQGPDFFMLSLDRFISINAPDWAPAINLDGRGFKVQASMPCLIDPSTYLFCGANAVAPGESLSSARDFEPNERAANTGGRPRLHPAWALQSIETEP